MSEVCCMYDRQPIVLLVMEVQCVSWLELMVVSFFPEYSQHFFTCSQFFYHLICSVARDLKNMTLFDWYRLAALETSALGISVILFSPLYSSSCCRSLRPGHLAGVVAVLDFLHERLEGHHGVPTHRPPDTRLRARSSVWPSRLRRRVLLWPKESGARVCFRGSFFELNSWEPMRILETPGLRNNQKPQFRWWGRKQVSTVPRQRAQRRFILCCIYCDFLYCSPRKHTLIQSTTGGPPFNETMFFESLYLVFTIIKLLMHCRMLRWNVRGNDCAKAY